MRYKISTCKKTNIVTIEILNKPVPEEFINSLQEHKINHVDNLIHFRLSEESNVLNRLDKLPKTLELIDKYIDKDEGSIA